MKIHRDSRKTVNAAMKDMAPQEQPSDSTQKT